MAALYGRGGLVDGRVRKPGRSGLGQTGANGADWRTGGPADGADYRILNGADWGRRGGLGRTGRTGWTGELAN